MSDRHYRCDGREACGCGFCRPFPVRRPEEVTVYGEPSVLKMLLGQPDPDAIDMGTRHGMPVVGCGHDSSNKWLTRHMVVCRCGLRLDRETYWEVAMAIEVLRPKVHCYRWKLGDNPDRYHGNACRRITQSGRSVDPGQ